MLVDENSLSSDKQYEARGIVARINPIGVYGSGGVNMPIYQFLTMDCGPGREKILVEFVGPAPYNEVGDTNELDFSKVKEGDIIVQPGFLYRRRTWTGELMTKHLEALKRYKPKIIVSSEVDRSTPAQEITIDPLNLTKQ